MITNCRCRICSRPIKKSPFKDLGLGPICAQLYFFENKGTLSEAYEEAQMIAQSQAALQSDQGEDEKFEGLFHNIDGNDPLKYIESELKKCHSIEEILKRHPYLGARTPFEVILNFPNDDTAFKDVLDVKEKLLKVVHTINNNFRLLVQELLYNGSPNMMEVQIAGIRELINEKNQYKELNIKDIFKGDEVSDSTAKVVIRSLKTVSTLIPDKYKKNVPPITVLIREDSEKHAPGATIDGDSVIVLNVRKNNISQAAEAFHEYIHLIERFNPKIMKYTNEFVKLRRTKKEKVTIEEIGDKYKKHYLPSVAKLEVYEDHFLDIYAGRTYGNIDGENPVPTEVLTVGSEALILDPTGFYLRDNNYYQFITKFLKGRI